jgi:hypothetical protein
MALGKISSTGWFILLVLSLAPLGCGTGGTYGGGSNSTSNATMQAGQWEFVLTPSGGYPVYLEANLTISFLLATLIPRCPTRRISSTVTFRW